MSGHTNTQTEAPDIADWLEDVRRLFIATAARFADDGDLHDFYIDATADLFARAARFERELTHRQTIEYAFGEAVDEGIVEIPEPIALRPAWATDLRKTMPFTALEFSFGWDGPKIRSGNVTAQLSRSALIQVDEDASHDIVIPAGDVSVSDSVVIQWQEEGNRVDACIPLDQAEHARAALAEAIEKAVLGEAQHV